MKLDRNFLDSFVAAVLSEDVRSGDITTETTVPKSAKLRGGFVARERIVVAGLIVSGLFFRSQQQEVATLLLIEDGETAEAGACLMNIEGSARPILTAERSALNLLQHLSGIATLTRQYVEAIAGTECVLLDTRKTTPGLRMLEKYASGVGGAVNHRMALDDAILIKDNHIAAAGNVAAAVRSARAAATGLRIQVEVDTLEQLEVALSSGVDSVLCDNMSAEMLRNAVQEVRGSVPIEASGGISLANIGEIAATGVDYISVGRITQSAPAVDIGLDCTIG